MRHIKKTETKSYCGYTFKPFDWAFMDLEHAQNSVKLNTLVQPCQKCLKAAIKDFGSTGSACCEKCDMKWTKEPPTEPGWYWCYNNINRLYMVFIERNLFDGKLSAYTLKDDFRYNLDNVKNAYWQGPLPVPEVPEGE